MSTPTQVVARIAAQTTLDLLDDFESAVRLTATTEAVHKGGPIPECDFIAYNSFRRELPLYRRELLRRAALTPSPGAAGDEPSA